MPQKKLTTQQFIDKANKIHNHKYLYESTIYEKASLKLKIICKVHGEFEQIANDHLNGRGCRKCNCSIPTHDEIIKKITLVHGNNLDLSKVKYKNNRTKIEVKCNICNYEFTPNPTNLLRGHGCPQCANNIKRSTDWFKNESVKIYGDNYDYSNITFDNMNSRIKIFCNVHKIFQSTTPSRHINGQQCKLCKDSNLSFPVYKIKKYLDDNNIMYYREFRFDDCKNTYTLPFDFYIEDLNLCIEYDGEQHFKPISHWGGETSFKQRVINDDIKTQYCKDNNITLLRLKYDEDYLLVLNNYLKQK